MRSVEQDTTPTSKLTMAAINYFNGSADSTQQSSIDKDNIIDSPTSSIKTITPSTSETQGDTANVVILDSKPESSDHQENLESNDTSPKSSSDRGINKDVHDTSQQQETNIEQATSLIPTEIYCNVDNPKLTQSNVSSAPIMLLQEQHYIHTTASGSLQQSGYSISRPYQGTALATCGSHQQPNYPMPVHYHFNINPHHHEPQNPHHHELQNPHHHELQNPPHHEHHADHYPHSYQEDHLHEHQGAYNQHIRMIKLEGEAIKLQYMYDMTKTSFEQFIGESHDAVYKDTTTHNYILRSLNKFEKRAIDIMSQSQINVISMRSLEYLPYNQRLVQLINNMHEKVETLCSQIKSSSELIFKNLQKSSDTLTDVDLHDIKDNITFPIFNGKQNVYSLNIYQYLNQCSSFFRKRRSKDNIKSNYIKNHIYSPAKELIFHHIEYEENFDKIKSILKKFFGKWSHMIQELSYMHQNIGPIPSTKGNKVPWISIERKVKLHLLLLQKAKAIGNSFLMQHAYTGMIIQYLPADIIILLDDDAKYIDIKRMYDDIERQASRITETYDNDADDDEVRMSHLDLTASFLT